MNTIIISIELSNILPGGKISPFGLRSKIETPLGSVRHGVWHFIAVFVISLYFRDNFRVNNFSWYSNNIGWSLIATCHQVNHFVRESPRN